jgi:hypothetical protein
MAKEISKKDELVIISHENEQDEAALRQTIMGMPQKDYHRLWDHLAVSPPLHFPADMVFMLARLQFNKYIENRMSQELYGPEE